MPSRWAKFSESSSCRGALGGYPPSSPAQANGHPRTPRRAQLPRGYRTKNEPSRHVKHGPSIRVVPVELIGPAGHDLRLLHSNRGRDKEAETASKVQGDRCRDNIPRDNPANSGLVPENQEISVRTRMRGGPGSMSGSGAFQETPVGHRSSLIGMSDIEPAL